MRKLVLLGSLLLSLALPAAAQAAEPNNCRGQTTAFLAQAGASEGVHGLGGVSHATGLTVKELHQLVGSACAG